MNLGRLPILAYLFDKNPWESLVYNKWTVDTNVIRLSRDAYKILKYVGIGVIAISIVILYIRWGTNREDRKGSLIKPLRMKIIFIIALAAFVYLVNLVWRLFDQFAAQLIIRG